ncbi:signal recognition particle subunit FFH/SRP54 (srp54) [Filimonas lacunae]|uniref:Signal recognition particle subunit FFH/SRP54 (Srp54) n=1 Tax=Filimonas lacunae TaxID=477680 RepID=A0A1N7QQD4_9BACT|nr:AAA family ATPase [Filimonas lacunae]SIT25102.1 signal recognition particle subunit FFH/SRP54 (srp54) [Filimonas lacunae]
MQLQQANRRNVKIKMALQGPAGAGKTYSALLLAYGLCGDWEKIAVVDSENQSAALYADLGNFLVLPLHAPFTPESYIEAITICENKGIEVIVLDSITHEWAGVGGILDIHAQVKGNNSYTNWLKVSPRHEAFVQKMLQSPVHIISTIRSKQDYILVEKNGKQVPEKVGIKGIQRANLDYEFTLLFELDKSNKAVATKDRTSLFSGKPAFILTAATGKQILDWCTQGGQGVLVSQISACNSMEELLQLFYAHPVQNESDKQAFSQRRKELEGNHALIP